MKKVEEVENIEEKQVQRNRYGNQNVQSVYVSSIRPPFLQTCSNILELLKFLDRYDEYNKLGGEIKLVCCLSSVLIEQISFEVKNFGNLSDDKIKELLKDSFKPKNKFEFYYILQELKFYGCQGNLIDAVKWRQFVKTFNFIVKLCEGYLLSKQEIMNIFLNKIVNEKFRVFLIRSGVKDVDYERFNSFAFSCAEEWNQFQISAKLMNINLDNRSFDKKKKNFNHRDYKINHLNENADHRLNHQDIGHAADDKHDFQRNGHIRSNNNINNQHNKAATKNICFGCGHITNPPHKKADCPHKDKEGWGRRSVVDKPLTLSLISSENIALIEAKVNNIHVNVGLDSLSSETLISRDIANQLDKLKIYDGDVKTIKVAGNMEIIVNKFIDIEIENLVPDKIKLTCGVADIPVDILISWGDIKKYKLLDILLSKDVSVEEFNFISPEEEEEEDINDGDGEPDGDNEGNIEIFKNDYPTVFRDVLPVQPAKVTPMQIILMNDKKLPNSQPPRRFSETVKKFIYDEIQKWLHDGVISHCDAAYASQITVVHAKGRDWRLCIDFRELNEVTKSNVYPIPNLKSVLRRVSGKNYYAKIDLKKGYLQAPLDEKSREFSAFISDFGVYQFNRIPFGLKNAPGYFQYILSKEVLNGLLYIICELYIDDIIIFADNMQELKERFILVLERLKQFNIIVNSAKCKFGLKKIEFLGHIVSKEGIQLSENKINDLKKIEEPISKSTLKSFLGLTNYFREFVPNYADKVYKLEKLLSNKMKFEWDEKYREAFQNIKDSIINAGILHIIDYELPIVVRTDASENGIGAVLFQNDGDNIKNIAFMSKKFSKSAKKWSTYDKEAYAIYFALKKWFNLLQGHKFSVQTDHKNLTYIQNTVDGKVARWRMFLQELDFNISYIPGRLNVIADNLSRCCIGVEENFHETLEKVHNAINGHLGINKTIKKLQELNIYWKNMRRDVISFIKSCPSCQKSRNTTKDILSEEVHVIENYEIFEEVSVDYRINLPADVYGNTNILVVIDNFSKYVELFPVKEMNAEVTANCLLQVISRYGLIKFIRSDLGSQFIGDICSKLCDLMNIKQITTSGYNPQSNGIVERTNAEIKRHLQILINDKDTQNKWSFSLPLIQRILNSTIHKSTGYAPAKIIFGDNINLDRYLINDDVQPRLTTNVLPEYINNLINIQSKIKQQAQINLGTTLDNRINKKSKGNNIMENKFKANELVVVINHNKSKLDFKWKGPFKVIKKLFGNVYEVEDLRNKKKLRFNSVDLKRFNCPSNIDPINIAARDESEYVVKEILDHKLEGKNKKNKTHYYFLVEFEDESKEWLPYLEVRELQAFDIYLQNHQDFAKMLKLKILA